MNVLSFAAGDEGPMEHDAAAAIIVDGQLVAAAAEERFSRIKHDGRFPAQSIAYCLRAAGLDVRDVDALAIPDLPYWIGPASLGADTDWATVHALEGRRVISRATRVAKRLSELFSRSGVNADMGMHRSYRDVIGRFRQHFGHLPPLQWFAHHRSHAAASFYTSGLSSAAVLTADNVGGLFSTTTWMADDSGLRRLRTIPCDNSLGAFYESCSCYAGLGEFGVGKLMGLAPYGNPAKVDREVGTLLALPDDEWFRQLNAPSLATLGFAERRDEDILAPPFPDFAAAVQSRLEQAILRAAQDVTSATGSQHLCLGGGVFFNCSANGLLMRSGYGERLWVFPASGDAGLSVGAASLCALELGDSLVGQLDHAYLGPEYSETEIDMVLSGRGDIVVDTPEHLPDRVAALIASGGIVAWFQGRMEFGPRALGNRSILADPRRAETRDRVNVIKHRESWRPLAPVVKAERANDFFELPCPSPFMLMAAPVHSHRRAEIAAVVHVDGSARPQTLTSTQNPRLYALLDSFERLTGIPLLLNTSFNDAAEPIVCSPADALSTFLRSELDALVIGNRLVMRRSLEVDRRTR